MTDFDFTGIPIAPPPPPIDPMVAREEKIANDTRVESELNRFIAAKQAALFEAPDAYYRKEGRDAVDGAPQAIQRLNGIKEGLLDGLANDYQRKRLSAALDAQMAVARDGISRHATEQNKAWQRQVALDRIDLLAKEAALHHGDDELIDALGIAATSAARAHARVDDGSIDTSEDAAAATARSRVVSAAIQARFSNGNTQGASTLFDRTRDLLDPAHAAPLVAQLQAAQRPPELTETAATSPAGDGTNESDPPSGRAAGALVAVSTGGGQTAPNIGRFVANVAGRVAPVASEVAGAALGAIPLMLTPTNSQGGVIDLADGLRAQWRPGQRSAWVERRINDGLFGSGIGAEWERIPIAATYEAGVDGRATLFIDPQDLEKAIGTPAASRVLGKSAPPPAFQALPASRPSIYEIRIGASVDGGQTTSFREATHEEIERLCPNYPMIQGVGLRAAAEVEGMGARRGRMVHKVAENELKIVRSADLLREMRIVEMRPEVALRNGIDLSFYRAKGSSVLDVFEVYGRGDEKRACVYDFKTGTAVFPDTTATQYAHEIGEYVKVKYKVTPIHITVVPVYLP